MPHAQFHKKLGKWEIDASSLAEMLDAFTYLDDIDLTLIQNGSVSDAPALSQQEIESFKLKPFQHQIDAVNYGLTHKKWLNLFSMGLGKTATLIYEAEALYNRGLIDHCLIICGVDSLRQQWKAECQKFSHLPAMVLGERITRTGSVRYEPLNVRARILKEPISEFFIITNIASIRSDEIVEAFKKSNNKFGMICLDECHRVATKSSQQGTNLLKLKADYQVAMSGSLVTNNPLSCYVPLSWIDVDQATLTNYKSQYCNFGGFGGNQIVGYKNLGMLRTEIESCSIRKSLNEVRDDMPQKTISVELVEMSEPHRKVYDAIVDGVKEDFDKVELKTSNLLALTTRLRQATSDPTILTSQPIMSSKLERCAEIVEDLIDAGEKVVVLDVFKQSIYTLAKMLERYHPLIGTGDLPDAKVDENIRKFRTDPNEKLLIGTTHKLGTGKDLPEAHYLVMISTPWTWAEFSQNTDRIYRIVSDQNVVIKVLINKDSIDERVWDIVNNKKHLADYLVDGKEEAVSDELKLEMINILRSL